MPLCQRPRRGWGVAEQFVYRCGGFGGVVPGPLKVADMVGGVVVMGVRGRRGRQRCYGRRVPGAWREWQRLQSFSILGIHLYELSQLGLDVIHLENA